MIGRIGQKIDNYKLLRFVGAGAFGEVYVGEHMYRKTVVALKVFPPIAHNDLYGFINEARIFKLKHHNIVQVLDFGVHGNVLFIVMDYASHGTLRERHPRGSRLSLQLVISYVKQIAAALQYAHDEKLVHRDIKPENVLLGSQNELLVSDFGIATMVHSSRSMSRDTIAGTAAYMAPEQIQGKPCFASDQYALSVLVYEWLSGRLPFEGTLVEVATQHLCAPPPSLRLLAPEVPVNVEKVVLRALAKDPSQRFKDVQEFFDALEQAGVPQTGVTLFTYRGGKHVAGNASLAWSPDSAYIASAIYDYSQKEHTIQVWNVATGTEMNTYHVSNARESASLMWLQNGLCITYAEDGSRKFRWNRTITGDDYGRIHYLKIASGACKSIRTPYHHIVSLLACSPNSKYVSSVSQNYSATIPHEDSEYTTGSNVEIYDFAEGSKILEYDNINLFTYENQETQQFETQEFGELMETLSWSPDSQYFASVGDSSVVHVWNVSKKVEVMQCKEHKNASTMIWSPDSRYMAIGGLDTIEVWDVSTRTRHAMYKIEEQFDDRIFALIQSLSWSPDGTYLAAACGGAYGWDERKTNAVRIWNVNTKRCVYTYYGHVGVGGVYEVAWSPDGSKIASISSDDAHQDGIALHVWIAPH